MNSTPNPKAIDPNDVLIARADERLAHAYEQIARADEQLVRVNEKLSKLEHDAAPHPAAVPGRRPSRGRAALRGLIGLLLAGCIFVAAFVSQSSYGDAAKQIFARWTPQLIAAQPSPSALQVAAASQSAAAGSSAVAAQRTVVVIGAAAADARALVSYGNLGKFARQGERRRSETACQ